MLMNILSGVQNTMIKDLIMPEYRRLCQGCPALQFADDGSFCGLGFTILQEFIGGSTERYRRYSTDCKLIIVTLTAGSFSPKIVRVADDQK